MGSEQLHKYIQKITLSVSYAEKGGEKMNPIAKELLMDCSTKDEFCFSLRCAECGEAWKSRSIRFSKAGVMPASEGKRVIFNVLYKREKEDARMRAVEQAGKTFNLCPICKRLVCDRCFLVCDDLDMCTACARRLQEKGEPVA